MTPSPDLREALEVAESWLDRWASHVGSCRGDNQCTCGLTAAKSQASVTLSLLPSDRDDASTGATNPPPGEGVSASSASSLATESSNGLADYIRDQVCCPRMHGCELVGAEECPAERVRSALLSQGVEIERLKKS